MYVRVRIDGDLWNEFTGVTKFRRGDVSREFSRALKLYLGSRDNTLAVREYFRGMEELRELINVRYDLFDEDLELVMNSRVRPINPREGFEAPVVRAIVEECLKRGVLKCCIDDFRRKKVELPDSVDEMVQKVLDNYTLAFDVEIEGRRLNALLSKDIFRFVAGFDF